MTNARALQRILLATLAFASCVRPLSAQTFAVNGNVCDGTPNRTPWPPPAPDAVALEPREDGALHRHADRNPEADVSTASSFEAFRALGPGNTIYLRICSAKVMVHVSPASNRLHLTIRLRKELPKGRTVADYIPLFSVDSKQAELQFKAPKDLHPEITLEVPESTAFKFGLGSGSIEFDRIPGNLNIGIGKGDLLLHANGNADYSSINAGFGIGGMRDKRPGGHNVGYLAGGWKDQGSGKYNVELGAGWGDLILLPSP